MKLEIKGNGRSLNKFILDNNILESIYKTKTITDDTIFDKEMDCITYGFLLDSEVFLNDESLGTLSKMLLNHAQDRFDLIDAMTIIPNEQLSEPGLFEFAFTNGLLFENDISDEFTKETFIKDFIDNLKFDECVGVYALIDDCIFIDGSISLCQVDVDIRLSYNNKQYLLSLDC